MTRSSLAIIVALGALASSPARAASASGGGGAKLDFNRDIRPILADNCFACHGNDPKGVKGGFRLDQRESATSPNKHKRIAIVPGHPERSGLVTRIDSTDNEKLMPPPESHKRLTEPQKQTLKRWISEGAEYQTHWAFTTVTRPPVPTVSNTAWPRNEIDRFVLARLEAEGLQPSPEADRRTLIRRLSLDLLGLPPEVKDVEAFVNDPSPDAYDKLVERILQSPHYGERMAMWWLDGARYADSNGFQDDSQRFMWPWRDWVIRAFNDNKPFDQFTIEQLAGDMLPGATVEQKVATGFNRNHRLNTEGGIIAEEWRVETVIDRVETTSLVWLGITMGCARCHDHKYDPFTQKEFYQLFAIFNNVPESGTGARTGNTPPVIPVPGPEDKSRLAQLEAAVTDAKAELKAVEPQLAALQKQWEPQAAEAAKKNLSPWSTLAVKSAVSTGKSQFKPMPDGSMLVTGKAPGKDTYEVMLEAPAEPITALLLEAMPDPSLPTQGLGRSPNGNFVLTGFDAELIDTGGAATKAKLTRAAADYSQKGWDIQNVITRASGKGWAILPADRNEKPRTRYAMFVFEQPLKPTPGARLKVTLRHDALGQHSMGRFRLSAASQPADALKPGAPDNPELKQALLTDAAKRTPKQRALVTAHFRANFAGPITTADRKLAAAVQAKKAFEEKLPNVMVMEEMTTPREAYFLRRGQYDQRGDQVFAALPASLPPLPKGQPMNRLGFARWLVDPSHPLTSRVTVNRLWEMLFGVGIVKSSENLGMQSEFPSHRELLDWLAAEFMHSGWNIKHVQRLIVTSATYRQSSAVSSQLKERDPENRLLARGARFRVNAEIVRDNALAVSGLLVDKLGGPAARPYQPDGVWDETSVYGNLRNYQHDKGDGLYRRSMYTIWKRTAAPPDMTMFDMPNREICTVRRARTNTPLQALALLNEVTYIEAARVLAQRMMHEGGSTPAERIDYAFRRAVARPASAGETQLLVRGLESRLAHYRANLDAAKQLVATGEATVDATLDAAELAAYTMTASVILNLDETITRE